MSRKAKRRLLRAAVVDHTKQLLCVREGLKRDRVADRDLGEHLAVELDAGRRQLADELGVADTDAARGRVDTHDPQRAEVTLANLARAVHVHPRVLDRLVGDRVAARALATETAGRLENAVTAATCFESSFCARH